MPLQLVEPRLLLHNLTQDERKQLFVIPCLREVFAEALVGAPHTTLVPRAKLKADSNEISTYTF